jgi:hypothetical protein
MLALLRGFFDFGSTSITKPVKDTKHQLPPWPSPEPTPHKDYIECNPPELPIYRKFTVFTAGSIEMGDAVNWQPMMAARLSPLPITVCNPRRGKWDKNITQQAADKFFKQQVDWERDALEQADVICFFFDTETKSPVSLLELGRWAASDKVIVCCGDDYWKSGNVHLACEDDGITYVKKFEELVPEVVKMLKKKGMKLDHKGDLIGENVHLPKEKPKKTTQLEEELARLQKEKAGLRKEIDGLQAELAAQPKL